ncbi:hypothetical protein B0H16DRAFT_1685951 [Mycena metata]|uniref:Uncharacterized protein n=1 Tax=Mycena metata TaxID=1033252 RepID=A0AAD7JQG3_9AGAR|nr:hypothetical protein B0H16DRAFT_1685951 [Mycena metata]
MAPVSRLLWCSTISSDVLPFLDPGRHALLDSRGTPTSAQYLLKPSTSPAIDSTNRGTVHKTLATSTLASSLARLCSPEFRESPEGGLVPAHPKRVPARQRIGRCETAIVLKRALKPSRRETSSIDLSATEDLEEGFPMPSATAFKW